MSCTGMKPQMKESRVGGVGGGGGGGVREKESETNHF